MGASWTWAWVSVVALGFTPGAAAARDTGRERGEGAARRAERAQPRPREQYHSERHDSGRQNSGRQASGQGDSGRQASGQRDSRQQVWGRQAASGSGHENRYSDRGGSSHQSWRGSGHDQHNDSHWRGSWYGSYDGAPHGGFSFGYRSRYPAHYAHGYYYRHGYYFPRYYYDYDSYPTRAAIRVVVDPAEAEVYVDGYYAGVVDDFDGLFQHLDLAPGRHEITLRLDGYRTWSAEVYAAPGSTVKLQHEMVPGPSGPEYGPGPGEAPGAYGDDPGAYESPDERPQPERPYDGPEPEPERP